MKSRREEYVKRFEELTKQEIKNYNDSLLNIHLALNKLRKDIESSNELYAKHVAALHSQINELKSEINILKKDNEELRWGIDSCSSDFNNFERQYLLDKKDSNTSLCNIIEKQSLYAKSLEDLKSAIAIYDKKLDKDISNVRNEMSQCYVNSKEDNARLKAEILAIPSEAKALEERLAPKFSELAIEKESLLKEVKVIKKRHTIQESLNEYFHIQLDRLKARMDK